MPKKKRKSSVQNGSLEDGNSTLIALGASNGEILIYDVKRGELVTTLVSLMH